MVDTDLSPLAQALGRVPTGLYVVSTSTSDGPIGFVGSFVQQVGFEPPTMCVAVGSGRSHLEAIRASGGFALSLLDKESQGQMSAFFKAPPEGRTQFDALETKATDGGRTVLSNCLAWMDCELTGEHAVGDHVIVFGTVKQAERVREGEPSVHLRSNGLGY